MSASYSAPKMSFGHIGKVTLSEWRFYSINFIIYLFFAILRLRSMLSGLRKTKKASTMAEPTILSNHEFFVQIQCMFFGQANFRLYWLPLIVRFALHLYEIEIEFLCLTNFQSFRLAFKWTTSENSSQTTRPIHSLILKFLLSKNDKQSTSIVLNFLEWGEKEREKKEETIILKVIFKLFISTERISLSYRFESYRFESHQSIQFG